MSGENARGGAVRLPNQTIMSQTTQTQSGDAINQTETDIENEREALPNPERGCGHLEPGKSYLRSDVSGDGMLPAFVEFENPIAFKEDRKRSYTYFPGVQFELSVTGAGGLTETSPPDEITAHLERLGMDRPTGTTAGEMVEFQAHDLLMSIGQTYYETPEEFIEEAKEHGVNKAISVTSGNEPPVVNPGRTRLFLIHPNAIPVTRTDQEEQEVTKTETVELPNGEVEEVTYTQTELVDVERTEYVPGIIGYTYLTRTVYTEDADGNIPAYIQDYEATGSLDIVEIGEPTTADDESETEQETFESEPSTRTTVFDTDAVGEPFIDFSELENASLGDLSGEGWFVAAAPPAGADAFEADDERGLAMFQNGDEDVVRVTAGANLAVDEGLLADTASTTLGPYRVQVQNFGEQRVVRVTDTR